MISWNTQGLLGTLPFGNGAFVGIPVGTTPTKTQFGANIPNGAWNMDNAVWSIRSNDYAGLWKCTVTLTFLNNTTGSRFNPRIYLYKNPNNKVFTMSDSTQYARYQPASATLSITGVIPVANTGDVYGVVTYLDTQSNTKNSWDETTSQYVGYRYNCEMTYLGNLTEYSI